MLFDSISSRKVLTQYTLPSFAILIVVHAVGFVSPHFFSTVVLPLGAFIVTGITLLAGIYTARYMFDQNIFRCSVMKSFIQASISGYIAILGTYAIISFGIRILGIIPLLFRADETMLLTYLAYTFTIFPFQAAGSMIWLGLIETVFLVMPILAVSIFIQKNQ